VPILRGGRTVYGHALGVLMLESRFPRAWGDVGHARTWPFPVHYLVVEGATPSRVVGPEPDPNLLEQFVDGARALAADGVAAITTSCGYLAAFQRELAAAVDVPVLTSALLQVPLAARLIRPDQRVGILTERPLLANVHYIGAGWSPGDIPVVVEALPDGAVFPTVFVDGGLEVDTDMLHGEMVEAATRLVQDHPEVGAIVLECTNFVPFSQAIRRATGRPVFDHYTLVMHAYLATTGVDFPPG